MIKASEINITTVTNEQIGRCHKVFSASGEAFYQVESERDSLTEYSVHYSPTHGFTCSCPAGAEGFAHCATVCKHVKWALAAAKEERTAMQEQEALNAKPTASPRIADTVPAWLLTAPVASHMSLAPCEI